MHLRQTGRMQSPLEIIPPAPCSRQPHNVLRYLPPPHPQQHLLGSIGIVEQDLHGLGVQIVKLHVGDAVRLQIAVKDLKQVRAAASQHRTVRHQLVTAHLERSRVKSLNLVYGMNQ